MYAWKARLLIKSLFTGSPFDTLTDEDPIPSDIHKEVAQRIKVFAERQKDNALK